MAKEFDLVAKDWVTEIDAVHYCGVSRRKCAARAVDLGIATRCGLGLTSLLTTERISKALTRR
jgi:hypothetical protein